MTRKDIIEGLEEIHGLLVGWPYYQFEKDYAQEEGLRLQIIMQSHSHFSIGISNFSIHAHKVFRMLNLADFEFDEMWNAWVQHEFDQSDLIFFPKQMDSIREGLDYIKSLPLIIKILKDNRLILSEQKDDNLGEAFANKGFLTVILPEPENQFSSPSRLTESLDAISLIYESFAILENESPQELSVVSLDSGSDKSFDFLGNAKIIELVKDFIFKIFRNAIYYKEDKTEKRIDLWSKGLNVIDQIGTMVKNESISPEQGEILKRNFINGKDKFINAGAILPEFDDRANVNPKELMQPEIKLLSTPLAKKKKAKKEKRDKETTSEKSEGLTKKEKKQLKLLKKKGKVKGKKKK